MSIPSFDQLPSYPALGQYHGLSVLPPSHPDRLDHAARWLGHVQAKRIGTATPPSSEQLARHARDVRVLAWGVR